MTMHLHNVKQHHHQPPTYSFHHYSSSWHCCILTKQQDHYISVYLPSLSRNERRKDVAKESIASAQWWSFTRVMMPTLMYIIETFQRSESFGRLLHPVMQYQWRYERYVLGMPVSNESSQDKANRASFTSTELIWMLQSNPINPRWWSFPSFLDV